MNSKSDVLAMSQSYENSRVGVGRSGLTLMLSPHPVKRWKDRKREGPEQIIAVDTAVLCLIGREPRQVEFVTVTYYRESWRSVVVHSNSSRPYNNNIAGW